MVESLSQIWRNAERRAYIASTSPKQLDSANLQFLAESKDRKGTAAVQARAFGAAELFLQGVRDLVDGETLGQRMTRWYCGWSTHG